MLNYHSSKEFIEQIYWVERCNAELVNAAAWAFRLCKTEDFIIALCLYEGKDFSSYDKDNHIALWLEIVKETVDSWWKNK